MLVEIPTRNTAHPLLWWTEYHHILAHNIGAAIVVTVAAYALAKRRALTAFLACVAFHSHIAGDIIGARGPTAINGRSLTFCRSRAIRSFRGTASGR